MDELIKRIEELEARLLILENDKKETDELNIENVKTCNND